MGWRPVKPSGNKSGTQDRVGDGPYYPMQSYNGATRPNPARNNGQDIDTTPIQFRRYVNMGYRDVQIRNGLWNKVGAGSMWSPYPGMVWAFMPRIPGQTRGDVGGFHKRGPSTYNVQDMIQNGPGSQPEHPGGPGTIAGTQLYNPMSG